jgi:hypothetical protein
MLYNICCTRIVFLVEGGMPLCSDDGQPVFWYSEHVWPDHVRYVFVCAGDDANHAD